MQAYSKLIKTDWLGTKFDKGWGNGYVVLPKEHPFHGYDYDVARCDVDLVYFDDKLCYDDYKLQLNFW
jgi:hypothetical protein